jgi:hypothetical protein
MSDRHESGNAIDSRSEVVCVALVGIPRVHSHANVDAADAGMIFLGNDELRFYRSCKCVRSSWKSNAECIAHSFEDVSVVRVEDRAEHRIMTLDRRAHAVAVRLPTLRRALDIGEEKSNCAGRKNSRRGCGSIRPG